MCKMTVGSLFAGIGGFDLGLERTGGFEIRWQIEIDEYCWRVLDKHWPNVKRYGDIRTVTDVELVDVLCGGFPCQDISNAGKREGLDGERSGLWSEFVRLIRVVRPQYVLVENVAALLVRGMERVLGDLVENGYDTEWAVIPASSVGAPHRRDRVWIVAYPQLHGQHSTDSRFVEDESKGSLAQRHEHGKIVRSGADVADSVSQRLEGCPSLAGNPAQLQCQAAQRDGPVLANPCVRPTRTGRRQRQSQATAEEVRIFGASIPQHEHWAAEPDVGRVAHGIPQRVDRLKGLGNAVVPQIVEWIGYRILEHARWHLIWR